MEEGRVITAFKFNLQKEEINLLFRSIGKTNNFNNFVKLEWKLFWPKAFLA